MSSRLDMTRKLLGPVVAILSMFLLWEASVRVFDVPFYLLPPPSSIVRHMVANGAALAVHTLVTAGEALGGFIIGSGAGFIVGIAFAHSTTLQNSLYPFMVALKAVPIVALAPLLVLWFGTEYFGKVVMAALICFFPVIVSSTIGLRSVSRDWLNLFRLHRATRSMVFLRLRLPASMPHVLSGLRVASTLSVVGAVVGEFSGSKSGLGYIMMVSLYQLETDALFAGIVLASVIGIILFYTVSALEKLVAPWPKDEA